MKEDIVDLDAFERIIIDERKENSYQGNAFWAMFYTIPTFHNPTGMTLPAGNIRLCELQLNCCLVGFFYFNRRVRKFNSNS